MENPDENLSELAGKIHQKAFDAAMQERGRLLKGYEDAYWDIELTLKVRQLGVDWKPLKETVITREFEVREDV
jgi:hypothetical protein